MLHDLLTAGTFIAMVLAPCFVTLFHRNDT
jgi:hypothetical protein